MECVCGAWYVECLREQLKLETSNVNINNADGNNLYSFCHKSVTLLKLNLCKEQKEVICIKNVRAFELNRHHRYSNLGCSNPYTRMKGKLWFLIFFPFYIVFYIVCLFCIINFLSF